VLNGSVKGAILRKHTCKPTVESVNSPTYLTCKMASLSHVRTALCVVVLMVYRVWISLLRKHALHVKLYATSINYKHLNRKVFHTAYVKCSTLTSRGWGIPIPVRSCNFLWWR